MGGDGERVAVKWLKRIRAGYETDAESAKKHSLLARVLCNYDINRMVIVHKMDRKRQTNMLNE